MGLERGIRSGGTESGQSRGPGEGETGDLGASHAQGHGWPWIQPHECGWFLSGVSLSCGVAQLVVPRLALHHVAEYRRVGVAQLPQVS